jgi:hypothetical protein
LENQFMLQWTTTILLLALAVPGNPAHRSTTRIFSAEVVCIGCELKKSDGITPQCNLYSHHEHGLLLPSGQIWSILDNDAGHNLRTDHDYLTQKVRVRARPLPRAQYMEILSFDVLSSDSLSPTSN